MARQRRGVNLGFGLVLLLFIGAQAGIAGVLIWITQMAGIVRFEQQHPMIAISHQAYDGLRGHGDVSAKDAEPVLQREASDLAHARGGSTDDWGRPLHERFAAHGIAGFVDEDTLNWPNQDTGGLLTLLLLTWWLGLVLQGDGGQVNTMQRRHPMWEWYLGFPVPQSAVFVAEALTPAMSQPLLLASPIMPAVLAGVLSHSLLVGLCALPIGIVLLLAATVCAKALEVLIMLRCAPRSRGAWFAVMVFVGTFALVVPFAFLQLRSLMFAVLGWLLPRIAAIPSAMPLLRITDVGAWVQAMVGILGIGMALTVPAVLLMRVATARGLEGGFGGTDVRRETDSFVLRGGGWKGLLADPLLRKERLWLRRDRGALVQLIGVPLFMVASQFANMHDLLDGAGSSWNVIAAVIFFLAAMLIGNAGPRVLLSEGPALLLTLSWPRGLEDVLRMKVRVLFALVTLMVWLCLGFLVWMFPHDVLAILGVGLLWLPFGLAVSEKAVTLIRAPTSSGTPEPIPFGQRFLTGIGNSTFAMGVGLRQWSLVVVAIILNWVLAGAVWERFRMRLPYLFDQESEPPVRPPTILSGVLALVGYQELAVLIALPILGFFGTSAAAVILPMAYGVAAVVICLVVLNWHSRHGVGLRDILSFTSDGPLLPQRAAAVGMLGGALLAVVALGYQHLLLSLPWSAVRDPIARGLDLMRDHPALLTANAVFAVGIAPWVEEFLFRGLLFRAMLPLWGLRRSVLASAAFFAALHPFTSWPMVFPLGIVCALLYRRSGSLLPGMLLHACYNALLLYLTFRQGPS